MDSLLDCVLAEALIAQDCILVETFIVYEIESYMLVSE